MTENNERTVLTSDSGSFEVDSEGRLILFTNSGDNQIRHRAFLPVSCDLALKHLHIPEGVRLIDSHANGLRNLMVLEDVSVPETMISIGDHAFHSCFINRIVFPPSLKQIGRGSFLGCLIGHLEIRKEVIQYEDSDMDPDILEDEPENKLYYGGRSFKESTILEVKTDGKAFFVSRPGNSRLGILPETWKLPAGEWIRELMPEAEVIHLTL